MKPSLPPLALTADVGVLLASGAARAQLLITGNDEKLATIFGLNGSAMSDVGNFVDGDVDILRVDADALTKVANFALPRHPALMRGSTP
jgi:hypothetical protein